MASLKGLVNSERELKPEEVEHIDGLQAQIDEIWKRAPGNYQIDDNAWKDMPLFMDHVSDEDVEKNSSCAALSSIVYDEMPPEEIAENRKTSGNKAIQFALDPNQVNQTNHARAAVHCYTEGINAKCDNVAPNSMLYSNRSMGNYIIGNYGHGLADAQRAIILQPNYSKAYYRGAKCAERIHKFEIGLTLIERGLLTDPAPAGQQLAEFHALKKLLDDSKARETDYERNKKMQGRSKAAESSNIVRVLQNKGIKVEKRCEVSSDQMTQLGEHKPYMDSDGVIHVPVLFMYDEYNTTDFMQDVPTDCPLIEVVDDLMPFPFDDKGRYAKFDDVVAVYKIDDGVKMPQYYEIDMGWPLMQVFREPTYLMPGLIPVIHIVCQQSSCLKEWGLRK